MRTSFVFANRLVRHEHATLEAAFDQAEHVLASWKTVPSVVIHGDRRDGYPYILTVTRETQHVTHEDHAAQGSDRRLVVQDHG